MHAHRQRRTRSAIGAPRPQQQRLARRGGLERMGAVAKHQRRPHRILEHPQLAVHRRGGQPQRLRRPGDRARLCHGIQGPQLPQGNGLVPWIQFF